MHFSVHCFQKARIVASAFLLTIFFTADIFSQTSFCESYPTLNLPSGIDKAESLKDEQAIVLFERRILELGYEGETLKEFEVVHRKYKIIDAKAKEDLSELYVPLTNVEEVLFIKAKTISTNGSIVETSTSKIKSLEKDGIQYKVLAVEGAEINGTIEFSYGLRKKPSFYRSYYLGTSIRTIRSEYWVISPGNLSMDFKVFNTDKFEKTDSILTIKDRSSYLRIYNFENIPPTYYLGNIFPYTPHKYRIESSVRRNSARPNGINYEYNDITRINYDLVSASKDAGAKEIKKIVDKMGVSNSSTELEKIIAVESYIKKNYSQVEMKGEESHTIKYLNATKTGTDKAIIALYSGVFDVLGIKHELGFTCNRTTKFIEEGFENWSNLNDWIIRFPASETYIMVMVPTSPPGYMSNDFRGTNMVRMKVLQIGDVKSAVADLVKIVDGPIRHQKENITIEIDENFETNSKYEYKITGYEAAMMKWFWDLTFVDQTVIVKMMKDLVEGRYEDIKTENITFKFDGEYGKPDFALTLKFKSKLDNLMEKAGDNYIFYPGRFFKSVFVKGEIPADYAYPIQAKESTLNEMVMEIPIPAGYGVEIPTESNIISNVDFGDGKILQLNVGIESTDRQVKVSIKEDQRLGKIQPTDVVKLNQFLVSLEKIEKIYFVINKK